MKLEQANSFFKFISYLLLAQMPFVAICQTNNNQPIRIEWSAQKPIEWSDFKARPDYSNYKIAAITSSLIQYKYFCENNLLIFDSKAIFECEQSWVKPENKNQQTLIHERLHFDITEYYNRVLKAKIAEKQWTCNQVSEIEDTINKVLEQWRTTQQRYDTDTWYSLNSRMQEEWNNLVRGELYYEQ